MKFIAFVLAILTGFLAGQNPLAASTSAPQPFITPDTPANWKIYNDSYALCSDPRTLDILKFAYHGAVDDVFKGQILEVSGALDSYLNNMWFHVALEECFPQNLDKKLNFVTGLVASDIAGKAVGDVAVIYVFKRASDLLSIVKKFSRFGYYSLQTAYWSPFVYDLYKQIKKNKNEQAQFLKTHPDFKETLDLEKQGKIQKADFGEAYRQVVKQNADTSISDFQAQLFEDLEKERTLFETLMAAAQTPEERLKYQKKILALDKIKTDQLAAEANLAQKEKDRENPPNVSLEDLEKMKNEVTQTRQTVASLKGYEKKGHIYYRLSFTSEIVFGLTAANSLRILTQSQDTLAGRLGALSLKSANAWQFWAPMAVAVASYAARKYYQNDLELTEQQKREFQNDLDDELAKLNNMEATYQSIHGLADNSK